MRLPDARAQESGLPPTVSATVVTVGTFDGMHRGHRDVVQRLVDRAAASGLPSLLLTFDPHPLEVVNPAAAPQLLTSREEKIEILAETGLDYVAVLPFTRQLADYSAEQFVELVLRGRFRMRELLIGYDHGFGRSRAGDVSVLKELGARDGFEVNVVEAVEAPDGHSISSTAIRRSVAGGDLDKAADSLGRLYSVGGTVTHGDQRGRRLGFPTINLVPSPRKLLPPEGVYAARVQTPRGTFGAMLNLGPRPTFGDHAAGIEAYLFDTDVDLYGAHVRLEFLSRLRDTRRFPDAAALVEQIKRDEIAARSALTVLSVAGNVRTAQNAAGTTRPRSVTSISSSQ
ncbi:MAG: bifunctional riboflavin kinase/FAD synthetase [Gemmatimonadaceae bacterium]